MRSIQHRTREIQISFENYFNSYGVQVRFADNAYINDTKDQNQGISYCGLNSHHQNVEAEKCIRDLHDHSRVLIVQAVHKWQEAITTHKWPYAVQTICLVPKMG